MKPLTIVATLKAKKGNEQKLKDVLRKLVPITHKEKGCFNCDMHQSVEDPGTFVFHENWESCADWDAHMNAPHPTQFSVIQANLADSWTLFVGERTH